SRPVALTLFPQWRGDRTEGHRLCGRDKAVDIKTDIGQQLAPFTVFDEAVGDAEAFDVVRAEAGIIRGFQHGGAETAAESPFFDGDDEAAVFDRFQNRFRV